MGVLELTGHLRYTVECIDKLISKLCYIAKSYNNPLGAEWLVELGLPIDITNEFRHLSRV